MKFYPTAHAIDRAVLRFGLSADKAAAWITNKIKSAKYVAENNGGATLVYENDSVRFIVDGRTNAIITVHPSVRLDFIRPTIEREMRKIRRESTRAIRETERRLAAAYGDLAELTANYANARNPNTRELIGGRVALKETQIGDLKRSIERRKDEMNGRIKALELIAE